EFISRLEYRSPVSGPSRVLIFMLPGVGSEAEDLVREGMVDAVHARVPRGDVVVIQPDLAVYLEDRVTVAIHRTVIEPAQAYGYQRIWLLGVSLGGMGALLYASAHADVPEGLVLLSPFLGTRGTMAEVSAAGGLESWSGARSVATAPELRSLIWLKGHLARKAARPALYLGYGVQDRFASELRLLAQHLPVAQVAALPGGHDWPTWKALWETLLDRLPFSAPSGVLDTAGGANEG